MDEPVKPSEQRGGTNPDADEARKKGEWAAEAGEGIVPAELDASDDADVLGKTTGSDEPATEDGIDLSAGDNADATAQGGPELPPDAEPDLKDIAAARIEADKEAGD